MIISRTPYRISLFGGGTDYPAWYLKHSGAVLSASIDKYCYLTCRRLPPFFEHRHRIVWSKIENCQSLEEITHPVVREVLKYFDLSWGLEVAHVGDLPARSGVGSSSAFTVGLLHAMHALNGRMVSKHDLAVQAIHFEQEILRETVGSQDQVTAAYGGLNVIYFHTNQEITVQPVTLPKARIEELNAHLMLFFTGIKRTSSNVSASYADNLEAHKRQLRTMRQLVDEALNLLNSQADMRGIGDLLREAWEAKRSLSSQVSSSRVDGVVERAMAAGAIGGKLTGAGGGGFLLLFVPPERQAAVKAELSGLLHVPFKFEWSGSQIVFASADADYTEADRERPETPVWEDLELQGQL